MPEYRRAKVGGGTYFFTLVTARRQPLLVLPETRSALRQAIDVVRNERPFTIHAWVLMPDHLHCIWQLPEGDHDFGHRWGRIKSQVSKSLAAQIPLPVPSTSGVMRREAGLWQRRFWEHFVRDEQGMRRHVDYIHWNPVKHGLVGRVADWPYSTFHRYVKQGIYSADWGGEYINEEETRFGE